ncbi:MAG: hypothetical protein AVDCRST_MAG69-566 [uncultured Solirubrobacteraceae bacterium]|uniref:Uncharacterized protein n=1 Tax=uncultured Solirubrobacteraceae bacterium TaxID=1162706 RepID=A0A6J4RUV2_9ACTN|nr:MAG: hypothetical protein AVDCRST_MAG69-566 [uncultured Solirubrobacteraceae bacterium]
MAWSRLRLVVLLCFGSMLVHELRYLAVYGDAADAALSEHGHGYLAVLMPLAGLLLAAVSGHLLWLVAGRRPGALCARRPVTAATLTLALLGIYTGQEWLEGMLAAGHPGGLEGVFGHGGWIAVPSCFLVGCGLSLLVRGARGVAGVLLGLGRSRPLVDLPALSVTAGFAREARTTAPLARQGAERAPPVFVS